MGLLSGVEREAGAESDLGGADVPDSPGARELWDRSLAAVRSEVPAEAYANWLASARFVAEVNKSIVIAARDPLTLDRIEADFARPLQRVWRQFDPKQRRLRFKLWSRISPEVRDMVGNPWALPQSKEASPMNAGRDDNTLRQSMSFDTLVVGESNERAVGIAKRVASGAPVPAGIVVMYGQPGTGKTHLLKSIQAHATSQGDPRRLAYLSAEEFMTRFVEGARIGDTAELQAFVKKNELLLIDDLHWIAGKVKTDKAFFGAIRAVTAEGGHVIITADAAPGDMVGLSKELSSEIRGAAAVEVGIPDQAMRKEIVRRHMDLIAESTPNFQLTDEMITRIVQAVRGPGRELCGVLWSLQLETGYGEHAPTPEMLEAVIRRIAGAPRTPSLDDIKRACMQAFNLGKSEIESASKVQSICYPRQIAMYLSRVMTDKSYPQIAMVYKKKDHTTVLHAYRKVKSAMEEGDTDMANDVERAQQAIYDRLAAHDMN
ncbi:MAG: DnaA/Hda family protein [Pseudomonadota bacterium]